MTEFGVGLTVGVVVGFLLGVVLIRLAVYSLVEQIAKDVEECRLHFEERRTPGVRNGPRDMFSPRND